MQSFLLGHHQWNEFLPQEILQRAHPLMTYKCLVFSCSIHPSIQQNFLCIPIACISLYHYCPQRCWWPDASQHDPQATGSRDGRKPLGNSAEKILPFILTHMFLLPGEAVCFGLCLKMFKSCLLRGQGHIFKPT